MKKILIIGCILLSTWSCKAQNILPVEKVVDYYGKGIPNNITQIKDVNNVLGKFVGTWKGTYNAKNYEFRVVKYTRKSKIRNITEDELLIRYKITDSSGKVIEDTTALPNDSKYVIKGSYLAKSGSYVLFYQGRDYQCGQKGDIFIRVNKNNSNSMSLFLSVMNDTLGDCPKGGTKQILPVDGVILTKQ